MKRERDANMNTVQGWLVERGSIRSERNRVYGTHDFVAKTQETALAVCGYQRKVAFSTEPCSMAPVEPHSLSIQ
jgi:hypothetical protein